MNTFLHELTSNLESEKTMGWVLQSVLRVLGWPLTGLIFVVLSRKWRTSLDSQDLLINCIYITYPFLLVRTTIEEDAFCVIAVFRIYPPLHVTDLGFFSLSDSDSPSFFFFLCAPPPSRGSARRASEAKRFSLSKFPVLKVRRCFFIV